MVKAQGPLPVPHACYYVQQAALGLQHAFEKKMVHRDIKPQNLILAREGKKHIVKVLDFGLAKVMREKTDDTGLTGEGKMLGTPDYIAPEQTLDAAKADIRADIYSLGCTLYYLLSGRPPFSASEPGGDLAGASDAGSQAAELGASGGAGGVGGGGAEDDGQDAGQALSDAAGSGAGAGCVRQARGERRRHRSRRLNCRWGRRERRASRRRKPMVRPCRQAEGEQRKAAVTRSDVSRCLGLGDGKRHRVAGSRGKAGPFANVGRRLRHRRGRNGGSAAVSAVGVLLLALLGMWAGGVFKVKTKDGILVVEVNWAEPGRRRGRREGNGQLRTTAARRLEIRVKPGKRHRWR